MRHSFALWMAVLMVQACAGPAAAQHSQGYVFAGLSTYGETSSTWWHGNYGHFGAGGEGGLGSRFTVTGEIGGTLAMEGGYQRSAAILSAGPAFHFLRRGPSKLDPFVVGGVGLLAGGGVTGIYYYGGGANYWFHPRAALRMEYRGHVWSLRPLHLAGVRVGVSFR